MDSWKSLDGKGGKPGVTGEVALKSWAQELGITLFDIDEGGSQTQLIPTKLLSLILPRLSRLPPHLQLKLSELSILALTALRLPATRP